MRHSIIYVSLCALLVIAGKGASQTPATQRSLPSQESLDPHFRARLDYAEKLVRQTTLERQKSLGEVEQLRDAIRNDTGLVEVTPEAIHQLLQHLQEQKEAMEVEEAGAQGRRVGLEKAIARFSDDAKKRTASDEVAAEIQKVVDVREKQLQRLQAMRQQAVVAQSEVDAAESAVAAARAELAAARQRAAGAAGETLDAWNRELLNLSIADQERQAKLKFIEDRLHKLQPALGLLAELDHRAVDLARVEHRLDTSVGNLEELREMMLR